VLTHFCDVNRRPTIGWVKGLFLKERTKTSRTVTISFSQPPERATATRGRGPLVYIYIYIIRCRVGAMDGFLHVRDTQLHLANVVGLAIGLEIFSDVLEVDPKIV
jgi:hypothetical protein